MKRGRQRVVAIDARSDSKRWILTFPGSTRVDAGCGCPEKQSLIDESQLGLIRECRLLLESSSE
jgi:hypothetical protein